MRVILGMSFGMWLHLNHTTVIKPNDVGTPIEIGYFRLGSVFMTVKYASFARRAPRGTESRPMWHRISQRSSCMANLGPRGLLWGGIAPPTPPIAHFQAPLLCYFFYFAYSTYSTISYSTYCASSLKAVQNSCAGRPGGPGGDIAIFSVVHWPEGSSCERRTRTSTRSGFSAGKCVRVCEPGPALPTFRYDSQTRDMLSHFSHFHINSGSTVCNEKAMGLWDEDNGPCL
jgi:hypothetical protein